MRILYAGSPEASAIVLEGLAQGLPDGFEIAGVLTNPPSAKGRHGTLTPTPVADVALRAGLSVFTPDSLKAEARDAIAAVHPDILVCFAYGRIFGPKFMALFPKGGINLHPSLLPKYRGCAPVPAAILNRDRETGISVQRLAQEMDTGDILLQKTISLDGTETADSLLETVAHEGAGLLLQVLAAIAEGRESAVPQAADGATYCTMLKKEDGVLDWTRPAAELDAQIRAFYSWPLCYTENGGVPLRIHKAAVYTGTALSAGADSSCGAGTGSATAPIPGTVLGVDKKAGILVQTGDGILAVQTLQWQAKKAMNFADFLNGSRNFIGTVCVSAHE